MAPTISTTMQMIIGDVLAVALMRLKNFGLDQFAMNHPAGRIGRRMITKVKDLMISGDSLPLCHPQDKLVDTLVELSNKRCGCVFVVDEKKVLLGIFTDGDLRRSLQKRYAAALENSMGELMTRTPRWIGPEELAITAMHQMESDQKNPITVLAILDEGKRVVGLIKLHDIIQSGL
jgi:arabinose-5-phosphate isomerase